MGVWFGSDALAWLIIILAVRENSKSEKQRDYLAFFGWLAFNNLLDELFFDPTKLQWNEAVFAIIVSIWLIIKIRKQWQKRKYSTG